MRPANDEGPTVAAATPPKQTQERSGIVARDPGLDKRYRNLQAEAALAGLRVERVLGAYGQARYIVIRGGRAIDCVDLAAARLAVRRLGGAV